MIKSSLTGIFLAFLSLSVLAQNNVAEIAPIQLTQELRKEGINKLTQTIIINKDGTLHITEDFEIFAEGKQIKRGIYRDLNTLNTVHDVYHSYDIHTVTMDGVSIPLHQSINADSPNHHRIYLGTRQHLTRNKFYNLKLEYTTSPNITQDNNIDTLSYNIDGNMWKLDVREVVSIIKSPTKILKFSSNQRQPRAYKVAIKPTQFLSDDGLTLTTKSSINKPNLAVHFDFTPGLVALPLLHRMQESFYKFKRQYPYQILASTLALLTILYFIFYFKIKSSLTPHYSKSATMVEYQPPKNASPALCLCMINHFNPNMSDLLSTIWTSLATKGLLEIKEEDEDEDASALSSLISKFTKTKIELIKLPNPNNISLPAGEKAVYDTLINQMIINKDTYSFLELQFHRASKAIKEESGSLLFAKTPSSVKILSAYGLFVAPIIYLATPWPFSTAILFLLLPVIFYGVFAYNTLRRRTPEGKQLASHIDGLKMFIKATESNKFKIDPPKMTPEYHNKLLPYAVALGCD